MRIYKLLNPIINSFCISQASTDFFGRISSFTEQFPAWLLLLGIFFLFATIQLSLSRYAFWLIPAFLLMCMFSGNKIAALDTGSTLMRWWLIFCLCISSSRRYIFPGSICFMLGTYWLFSIVSALWSPNFRGGIQVATLSFALSWIAASGISGCLMNLQSIKNVAQSYLALSAIFIANGAISLGDIRGSRFAGSMAESVSATLFVITGGLLMPTLIWGFNTFGGWKKIMSLIGFSAVFGLCFLSGQRAGLFAGVISCIPLILKIDSKILTRFFVSTLCISAVIACSIQLFPQQSDFIFGRYFRIDRNGTTALSFNTTGRDKKWGAALEGIWDKPIIGHGVAADKISGIGGFHNAYLQEWYNGGVLGLALYLGASIAALFKTFRLSRSPYLDDDSRQLSLLFFSWMTVLFLVSLFESKLANPSNIMPFTLVLIGVMTHRLELHAKTLAGTLQQTNYL